MESAKNTSPGDGLVHGVAKDGQHLVFKQQLQQHHVDPLTEDEQQGDHQAALDGAQHLDLADVDGQQDEDDDV